LRLFILTWFSTTKQHSQINKLFIFLSYTNMKHFSFLALWITLLLSSFILSWCEEEYDIRNTKEYQDAKQMVSSWSKIVWETLSEFAQENDTVQWAIEIGNQVVEHVKEQATELWKQAEIEVRKQYETLKNDAKTNIKSWVNKKIDDIFDKI